MKDPSDFTDFLLFWVILRFMNQAVTPKPCTLSIAGQVGGSRVLNITTQGGKVIASSSNRGTVANVVTVNPKTLQLTAIKGAGGTTG